MEAAPAPLINTGRAVTLVAITVAPWLFGCVRFKEQVWLYAALAAAAAIALLVVLIRAVRTPDSGSLRIPLLVIPMFAFITIGAAQLLPASETLAGSRVTQAAELAQWELVEIRSSHFSFYPTATMSAIARYTFAIVAFFLGYILFRTPESQRLLWSCLLLNAVALVAFGLVQKFAGNGKLFWFVTLSNGGDPFASFVNRNNAIAFLYIGTAAALGLLVWAFDRRPARATEGFFDGVRARIAAMDNMQVALLASLALLATGVVASTSRSGALSFAVAFVLTLGFIAVRRRSGWPILLACVGIATAGAVVASLEIDERLKERIAKVDTQQLDQRMRVRHAMDAINVTRSLPVLGAGLGTHRYAYFPFVSEFGRLWAVNADNQYVEVAVEAGLAGLAVVSLFLLLALRLIWKGRVGSMESVGTVVAVLFLVISQAVHGVFDFGIILPATLTGAALLLGTAVASIAIRTGGAGASMWGGRVALPSIMLGLAVLCVSGLATCRDAAAAEDALGRTSSISQLSDAAVDDEIQRFDQLKGAEVRRRQARLLIRRYERQTRREIERLSPDLTEEQLDTLSSLDGLYVTVQRLRQTGRSKDLETTLNSPQVEQNLRPAQALLKEAVRQCPILPDTYGDLGRLSFVLDEQGQLTWFQKAVRLQPFDDNIVSGVGSDLLEIPGARSIGESFLRHSLATTRWRIQRDVLIGLNNRYGLDNIIERVCPQSGFAAVTLAGALARADLRQYRDRVLSIGLRSEQKNRGLESLLARAEIHLALGNVDQSLAVLKEAVSDHPGSAEAHYRLARALRKAGQLDAALFEARVATGIDPDEPNYLMLLQQLNDLTSKALGGDFETSRVDEIQPSRT